MGWCKRSREKRERPSKDLSEVCQCSFRPIDCFCRSGSAVISSSLSLSFLTDLVYSFPPLPSSMLTSSLSERESHVSSCFPFLALSTPVVSAAHEVGCCLKFVYLFSSWTDKVFCMIYVYGVEDLHGCYVVQCVSEVSCF